MAGHPASAPGAPTLPATSDAAPRTGAGAARGLGLVPAREATRLPRALEA